MIALSQDLAGRAPISAAGARADAFGLVMGIFFGVFALIIPLVIVLAVALWVRERRRQERLYGYALSLGWQPVHRSAPLPPVVAEAAGSRRTRLVLATRLHGRAMWLVWHQWTETVGDTTSTRNLTRYFVWLGPSYPEVRLDRRTGLGGLLKPVRGVGTGDAEFDRRFLIRGPGEHAAGRLLSPAVREGMVAGRVPPWQISGGVLIMAHKDTPRVENLQPWADTAGYLAGLLAAD